MKISYKGDYALKALLQLALNYNKGVVSINELARRGDIPYKFLEQVLLILKKGGFVDSKRGVSGGYYLAKAPGAITLGEAIRFIEGPVEPLICAAKKKYDNCKDFDSCVLRDIWSQIYMATSIVIDSITFAELARRVNAKEKQNRSYVYNI